MGLVLLILLFLNSIKSEFGACWLLLMALLAFPRASERCQQYILLSSRLLCVSRSPYPTPHVVEFQGARHCPRTALFPSSFSLQILPEVFRALNPQLLKGQRIRQCSNWHFAPNRILLMSNCYYRRNSLNLGLDPRSFNTCIISALL